MAFDAAANGNGSARPINGTPVDPSAVASEPRERDRDRSVARRRAERDAAVVDVSVDKVAKEFRQRNENEAARQARQLDAAIEEAEKLRQELRAQTKAHGEERKKLVDELQVARDRERALLQDLETARRNGGDVELGKAWLADQAEQRRETKDFRLLLAGHVFPALAKVGALAQYFVAKEAGADKDVLTKLLTGVADINTVAPSGEDKAKAAPADAPGSMPEGVRVVLAIMMTPSDGPNGKPGERIFDQLKSALDEIMSVHKKAFSAEEWRGIEAWFEDNQKK